MYLAEKSGKFMPKDMAARYEVIQWLMIQLTGVGPMFGRLTHFKMFAPKGHRYGMTELPERGEAALYGAREAAWRIAVPRRQRIFDRRHRDFPVDPQP